MTVRPKIYSFTFAVLGAGLFAASACSQSEPPGFGASGNGNGGGSSGTSGSPSGGSSGSSTGSASTGGYPNYGNGSSSRGSTGTAGGSSTSGTSTGGTSTMGGSTSAGGAASSSASSTTSGSTGTGTTGTGPTGACAVHSTGGIPLSGTMMNFLGGTDAGAAYQGYAFAYGDFQSTPTAGMSTACIAAGQFCVAGTTAINNPNNWGAGLGASLNQAAATGPTEPAKNPLMLPGSGLSYTLSSLPTQTMYITLTDTTGTVYYYTVMAKSGTAPWASFITTPWSSSNKPLPSPPSAVSIGFQVSAGNTAAPFDFCVTSLTL